MPEVPEDDEGPRDESAGTDALGDRRLAHRGADERSQAAGSARGGGVLILFRADEDGRQDVRVFGVGRWGSGLRQQVAGTVGAPDTASSITLLLDYQQAIMLEYLIRTGGHINVALRRFDQSGDVPTAPVTLDSLTRRGGSLAPR